MDLHPVIERFLRYVKVNTRSLLLKAGVNHPSSEGQILLMRKLVRELQEIGIKDDWFVMCEDSSFLVTLPATPGLENAPHVAFAAHMDTYPEVSGEVNPQLHSYEGGDIVLPKDDVVIPASDLEKYVGCRIITSDGSSLLGADDKAGIAAMMTAIDQILFQKIEHGPLSFWFCVDEEIGQIDVTALPEDLVKSWDVLWTVDGEDIGPIDVGCFICRMVNVTFIGQDAHPGVAGHKLRPAIYAAVDFANGVMASPSPMETKGLESFYYVMKMEGNASKATVLCAPRSFDSEESEQMAEKIAAEAKAVTGTWGVEVEVEDKILCHNTRAAIVERMSLLEPGFAAHKQHGFEPKENDVRGGTDGAMINMTFKDLPAPNMGTGANNIHSVREFLVADQLEQVPLIMLSMIGGYTEMER